MKILITGAAGAVGSTLVKGMGQRHQLRGFDRVEMPDLADSRVGDVADYDALLAAAEGMEAIIHLTGVDSEWEKALSSNFIGTYNMLEAARHPRSASGGVRQSRRGTRFPARGRYAPH